MCSLKVNWIFLHLSWAEVSNQTSETYFDADSPVCHHVSEKTHSMSRRHTHLIAAGVTESHAHKYDLRFHPERLADVNIREEKVECRASNSTIHLWCQLWQKLLSGYKKNWRHKENQDKSVHVWYWSAAGGSSSSFWLSVHIIGHKRNNERTW